MSEIRRKKIERLHQGNRLRVLDLFSGAGGLSLGFRAAGFEITAAVEIDAHAARTHAANFFQAQTEETRQLHGQARDITIIEPDDLMREYGLDDGGLAIDVVIGGPPCQAFARVGRAKLREIAKHPEAFLQDPRADLYLRFLHYVEVLQPLAILMENVPDALNFGGHNIAEETCDVLSEQGYVCAYTLLNSAFYGVPQMRERMFVLAIAKEFGKEVSFPQPTHQIELPKGYHLTRSVALQPLSNGSAQMNMFEGENYYRPAPLAGSNLPEAIPVNQALSDLPPIYAPRLLEQGALRGGVNDPGQEVAYPESIPLSDYARLMRNWPGYSTTKCVTGHVIRSLPRDYKLFARMKAGDQYPEAHDLAQRMFEEELERLRSAGQALEEGSANYAKLKKDFVPPYDPEKFPNKWWKMVPNKPARTLMAHIGKDSYSHIHYDSEQARTISVREAARIQSFPDGFIFSGMMNSAFRQAGNAVPPILAYHMACQLMKLMGKRPHKLPFLFSGSQIQKKM